MEKIWLILALCFAIVGCHSKKNVVNEGHTITSSVLTHVDTMSKVQQSDWLQNFAGNLKDFELTIITLPEDTNAQNTTIPPAHHIFSSPRSVPNQVPTIWHLKGAELTIQEQDSLTQNVTESREIQRKQENDSTTFQKQDKKTDTTAVFKPPSMTIVLIVFFLIVLVAILVRRFS